MSARTLLAALLVVGVAASFALPAFTEEPEAPAKPDAPASDPMMDAMIGLGKPGPEHAWMAFMIGSWNVSTKMWMGPGEPVVSTATMESRWIMGRRFVRSDYTGDLGGIPYRGEGTFGFNNAASRFESSWLDSIGSGISQSHGAREGDVVTVKGVELNPMMGGEIPFRHVYTKRSDDEYVMESYWTMPGMGEMKGMELVFTRTK